MFAPMGIRWLTVATTLSVACALVAAPASAVEARSPLEGSPRGLDPYLSPQGNGGYNISHYDVDLTYDAKTHGIAAAEVQIEATADQEIQHAFGHADLLFPKANMTVAKALEMAIEGETYEYTEMYPSFRNAAVKEGNTAAVKEMDAQIAESKEHAEMFKSVLEKASKRFAALAKVEERHANNYKATLAKVTA